MPIAAQLFRDDRGALRYAVGLDATVRDPSFEPIDVVVKDLSINGFRVVADRDLPVAAEIGLGLSGIGARRARVVWRGGGAYGCEFLQPISVAELYAALTAPEAGAAVLPFTGATPAVAGSQLLGGLSPRARLTAIVLASLAAWALVATLGTWLVMTLTR